MFFLCGSFFWLPLISPLILIATLHVPLLSNQSEGTTSKQDTATGSASLALIARYPSPLERTAITFNPIAVLADVIIFRSDSLHFHGRSSASIYCLHRATSIRRLRSQHLHIYFRQFASQIFDLLNEPVGVIKTPPSDQEVTQCRMASDSSANRPSGETPLMKSSFRINESVGGAEWAR